MDKSEAKQILTQSISNLHSRKGEIDNTDIEAEVINNACLVFLRKQKEIVDGTGNVHDQILAVAKSHLLLMPIAKSFTESALELFPDSYNTKHAVSATMGINTNVAWEGMWDYLRDYFEANHGIQIDEIQHTTSIFNSNLHKRYEAGRFISESEEKRRIQINFSDDNDILVQIAPSLSPKKAFLLSEDDNLKIYKGFDPDYLFEVEFDEFEEIQKFVLKLPNRNLQIDYFE